MKFGFVVIPAHAGIHFSLLEQVESFCNKIKLDSRLRGNDGSR